jgi:hypothetical protein
MGSGRGKSPAGSSARASRSTYSSTAQSFRPCRGGIARRRRCSARQRAAAHGPEANPRGSTARVAVCDPGEWERPSLARRLSPTGSTPRITRPPARARRRAHIEPDRSRVASVQDISPVYAHWLGFTELPWMRLCVVREEFVNPQVKKSRSIQESRKSRRVEICRLHLVTNKHQGMPLYIKRPDPRRPKPSDPS